MSTHYDTIRSRCARAQKYSTDADYANKTSSSAMAERPCSCGHCGMLCLCPKSSLCSCYMSGWPCAEHVCLCRKVGFFRSGWVAFGKYLTGKEVSATNRCWCQKTTVIAVSCGIKLSAVHHLVLSQYTHPTDGQTDRIALHAAAR